MIEKDDSGLLEDTIRPLIHQDLIEDTEENFSFVWILYQDFIAQKITPQQFKENTITLLKQPNFFDKIYDLDAQYPILNQPITKGRRQKAKPWSPEEDEILKQAVKEFPNDWGAVVARVGNGRTKAQCAQRWNRVVNPAICKANWTLEEEEKLMKAVSIIGEKSWTRVANQLGNRTDVQCRFKYFHIKNKLQQQQQLQSASNDQQIHTMLELPITDPSPQ